ncbi:MAG: nucleotidyltransferase domain-containing protein [Bacteroidota bacterium]
MFFQDETEWFILFGSRARNDAKDNSDYDLLIISKSSIQADDRLRVQALIRKNWLSRIYWPISYYNHGHT